MGDKYDAAIDYLQSCENFMGAVDAAWHNPAAHPAGCLFQYVTPTGRAAMREPYGDGEHPCGCLTLIRHDAVIRATPPYIAWTDALTAEIGGDERIPLTPSKVTPESLEVFAEWQRRLDMEIRDKVLVTG